MASTVIAIDGPAGAGKSTVARLLAEKLGITYVNTGNLYRALAYAARTSGVDVNCVDAGFLSRQKLEYSKGRLLLNGVALESELRTAQCASDASVISPQQTVRDYLLPVQRDAAKSQWIVMEGRDIGSVIFPDALCKFFVTASLEERARRRMLQRGESGDATLAEVTAAIRERDERDSKRALAPLVPASDAVIVDTSALGVDEVIARIISLLPAECPGARS